MGRFLLALNFKFTRLYRRLVERTVTLNYHPFEVRQYPNNQEIAASPTIDKGVLMGRFLLALNFKFTKLYRRLVERTVENR